MGKLNDYNLDNNITADDRLAGVDSNGNATRLYTISDIMEFIRTGLFTGFQEGAFLTLLNNQLFESSIRTGGEVFNADAFKVYASGPSEVKIDQNDITDVFKSPVVQNVNSIVLLNKITNERVSAIVASVNQSAGTFALSEPLTDFSPWGLSEVDNVTAYFVENSSIIFNENVTFEGGIEGFEPDTIVNQNSAGLPIKFWRGTQDQYDAVVNMNALQDGTDYIIIADETL